MNILTLKSYTENVKRELSLILIIHDQTLLTFYSYMNDLNSLAVLILFDI